MEAAGIIIGVVVIAAVLILLGRVLAGRGGLVQLSHLQCPKCGGQFDYAWIPGGSFTAVRFFHMRLFGCPVCGGWSWFNVWDTRVDPDTHSCGNIRIGPS